MPANSLLHSRKAVGLALLALVPGCAVDRAPSNAALGASSGGGAAYIPAPPPAAPPPVASRPVPAVPRAEALAPSRTLLVTAPDGEVMRLIAPPRHGTVDISGSGGAGPSGRYTPAAGYLGEDQFSISLGSGRRTVTVSISPGPQ